MSDAASQAKLHALAQYFRNGGKDPTLEQLKQYRGQPDYTGDMMPAEAVPQSQVENVPQWALHSPSAPESGIGAGTIDDMVKARIKHLQMIQAGERAIQNSNQPEDMSGYKLVPRNNLNPSMAPSNVLTQQTPAMPSNTNPFGNIPTNVPLTPDQENAINHQLNPNYDDEEDEDNKNTRGFTTDIGTSGGI